MEYQEGRLTIFEGPQRSGKTLAMSIFSLRGHLKGRNVYSNLKFNFPSKKLNFFELDLKNEAVVNSLRGAILSIDELNFWFDSRASMSGINRQFATTILQIKKLGVDLYGTTHHLSYLDKRFRENFDFIIKTNVTPTKREPGEPPEKLKMTIENGPNQKYLYKKMSVDLKRNPELLGLYDTTHVFDPFEQMGKAEEAQLNI